MALDIVSCPKDRREVLPRLIGVMTEKRTVPLPPELRALAARQWHDYQKRAPGTYFGEEHPELSLDQAYAVQSEVARLRCEAGDAIAGYKIGCVGPAVVEQFG